MVTFKEILESIVKKIKEMDADIAIQSDDISEGFERPSYFIDLDNINVENFMRTSKITSLTVRIIYFPKDKVKNQVEILDKMSLFEENFIKNNLITIDDYTVVEIENSNIECIEKKLHFSFDIELTEIYDKDKNKNMMENLEINGEVNDGNK